MQTLTDPTWTRNSAPVIHSAEQAAFLSDEVLEPSDSDTALALLLRDRRLDPSDIEREQLDRARELLALGWHRRAERVVLCGLRSVPAFLSKRCHLSRICPRCGSETAQRRAARTILIVRGFADPQFLTFELASPGPWGLVQALDLFVTAWKRIRKLRVMRTSVLGGVAGLEPHRVAGGLWAVHCHAVLDVPGSLDVDGLDDAWRALVGDRGSVLVPEQGSAVIGLEASAGYVCKPDDWCPAPGSMPLSMLRLHFRALRGRHLWFSWGTGRPRPTPNRSESSTGESP